MKLSAKASFLLSGIVLAVIAATSIFLFSYQQKTARSLLKQHLEAEAASLAGEIHSFADENLRNIAAIAGSLPRGALEAGNAEALREYLQRQQSFFPKFDSGLFILDRDGRFIADFPPHPELRGRQFNYRDYYQRTLAQEKGVVGAPYVSTRSGHPEITFTAPIKSASGQVQAVACASLDLLSTSDLGDQRVIGKTGFAYVVDQNRQILIHPDRAKILRPVAEREGAFQEKALGGYQGSGEAVDDNGAPVLAGSRRVPGLGWVVLTQIPLEEATASLHDGVLAVGLFFLAALAVVLPVGLVMMRRIARPLEALEEAVQVITQDLRKSEGALTRPFAATALDALRKMRSSDEIGMLARAFFQLSVRLKQTLGSLRSAAKDWERTFSSVQEALLVLDSEGKVLRLNRVAEDLFRTTKLNAKGRRWREVLASGHPASAEWPSSETLRETGNLKLTSTLPETPGIFELYFSVIESRGDSKGFLLMVTDVTEKTLAEERIRELAFHDTITRLPNRLLLTDRLEQAIATANRNNSRVGVLFLDLDDFKLVNDTFGHALGDELLRQVARRLMTCLRSNDTLARYAGDEFVAVLMDLNGPEEATTIASRMLLSLTEPFDLSGNKASVGASIGISVYPEEGSTPSTLINHADQAMYRAKGHGKNSFWLAESPAASAATPATATAGEVLPKQ